MKAIFAGIAVAAALATNAVAAERSPSFNWTGCYAGISAGGLWARSNLVGVGGATFNTDPTGVIAGGQIGCDYQSASSWLVGVEADFSGTTADEQNTVNTPPVSSETVDAKISWLASATARLGYGQGPWLLYGKGGAAWVRNKVHDNNVILFTFLDGTAESTEAGWTLGAGLEYALGPGWSARIEYDYYDFGRNNITISGTNFVGAAVTGTASLKQEISVVKVGLNYHFWTAHM
jgi:outer membrane immunogenic protein